ncbi:TetR/AcrR family transcriptional regulator [Sphingomonas cavernae]|nr:TetR/AcrR family transcriptional regulator [Sphingomonas cavernae]
MRKVDEANTEAKRTTILRAAIRCFNKFGLQNASIQDICREAGMRSGHLYYYYPSKDAIIEEMCLMGTEELVDRIDHMLDTRDIVSAVVDIHQEAEEGRQKWEITPALRLELAAETTRNERLRDIDEDQTARFAEAARRAVSRAREEGKLNSKLDPAHFVDIVMLLWFGIGWRRIERDFDLERYREAFALLFEPWLLEPKKLAKSKKTTRAKA